MSLSRFNYEEYDSLKAKLDQQVKEHQPEDLLQFCSTFFQSQLEKERNASHHAASTDDESPGDMHPLAIQDESMSDAEENDTVPDEIPDLVELPSNRGRRTSVSAESMQPTFRTEKIVIHKSDEQRARIQVAISDNFLFKHLDDEQYQDVMNAMAIKKVAKGVRVIEQGGVGDYFYVVESGQLDCLIDGKKVTSYGPMGSFGELALMYNAPRAASIIATTDCVLYALDRMTFRSILMENTNQKRSMYERFLSEVPIFKSLEIYERHKIADALESVVYENKDVVIREGDVGEEFYLIENGEAAFYKTLPDGTQKQVMIGRKGDYFGELALLNDKPRAATVVSNGRLKCATLNKKAFIRLLGPVMDILKRNTENYHAVLKQAGH
ncbi:hypothetical protein G6F46_011039 [Rhizopus delemar]|uniref:cAMP-dependent protein kinase regulatory subunit n=3 Tax=Rhizopus TaxID=4842 RepID=I1BXW6_RHIO9|nr:hypothetical protein RO3G_05751 [Rhizopus delemar RA 99-880]KAG1057623.1 hypothetical protein G6F43_000542 [Rhizopus delemar]KAG1543664.1 hypothetical protein G6F51_006535 [Rhizopus arrhizus]KAG1459234.1 hypothetical protein G6F55_004881 [Rhizopus delemar]KAG1494284.1 hypothetical protein G6F54_007984 [Rhizopus delemar]|eukprot:EIE81046.1 hypothetical protein RO3G_05751 [Rhizopus delemar RA 99-880]